MNDSDQRIVLLPHPGPERGPKRGTTRCEWPLDSDPRTGRHTAHRRKYLRVDRCQAVDKGGHIVKGPLEVWAEYEAATIAERSAFSGPGLPKHIHTIVPNPKAGKNKLNTDPWIFHDGFVWTICKHWKGKKPVHAVDELRQGDIVLFGSSISDAWCLDTVFVVDARVKKPKTGDFGAAYDYLVWSQVRKWNPSPFTGKSYGAQDDLAIPFSFVPAASASKPFARPDIAPLLAYLRKVTDHQEPSPKISMPLVVCYSPGGARNFWKRLIRRVFAQGLLLGTQFGHPDD